MWSYEKTLAASARTSSLANQEYSNKFSGQKTWILHQPICGVNISAPAKQRCVCWGQLWAQALVCCGGMAKTYPGHLQKSSRLSGRLGPLLGSPSLPQEGSGRAAQQPATSKSGPPLWTFELSYTIAKVYRKAAETRLARSNMLVRVRNSLPILNLLCVHTAVVYQDSRRTRVAWVRQGSQSC